jgi:hypothetical protein
MGLRSRQNEVNSFFLDLPAISQSDVVGDYSEFCGLP